MIIILFILLLIAQLLLATDKESPRHLERVVMTFATVMTVALVVLKLLGI